MSTLKLIKEHFSRNWGLDSLESVENNYLTKYFLSDKEYKRNWQASQFQVFRKSINFPSEIFNEDFQTNELLGGLIFSKNEFLHLKHCSETIGDNWLLIIEESSLNDQSPIIRLKFPSNIHWEEIVAGGNVSFDIFERPIRNYFIFGDSLMWGKYVGSDYEQPIDVIGYKKQYADVFTKNFTSL